MRYKRARHNRGSALVMALSFTFVTLGFGLAIMTMATSEQVATRRQSDVVVSRNVAEAGVDLAMWQLKQDPTWRCQGNPAQFTNAALKTTVAGQAVTLGTFTVKPIDPPAPDGTVLIRSSGLSNGGSSAGGKAKTVGVTAYPQPAPPLFTMAAFGIIGVDIESGYVYSYDSNLGAPDDNNPGNSACIGTNNTDPTCMLAKSNGQAGMTYGNVYYGPNTNHLAETYPKSCLTGQVTEAPALRDMPAVNVPSGLTNLGVIDGGTIPAGTYVCNGITGGFTTSGKVTLYCTGNITLNGGTMVPGTGKPAELIIYGTTGCTSIDFKGHPSITAAIYAPSADFQGAGGGKPHAGSGITGSLVCHKISLSQHFDVRYDVQLQNMSGGTDGYAAKVWEED